VSCSLLSPPPEADLLLRLVIHLFAWRREHPIFPAVYFSHLRRCRIWMSQRTKLFSLDLPLSEWPERSALHTVVTSAATIYTRYDVATAAAFLHSHYFRWLNYAGYLVTLKGILLWFWACKAFSFSLKIKVYLFTKYAFSLCCRHRKCEILAYIISLGFYQGSYTFWPMDFQDFKPNVHDQTEISV